jgi:hypothetical protein
MNCDSNDTADGDGDGVTKYEECVYSLDDTDADFDGDGLTDGQELKKLGTDPTEADSDGDFIPDRVEVEGFSIRNKQWYLNPINADTNGDGLLDSVDCPALVDSTAGPIATVCDTDGDGLPNPFEFDDDNDGVPDAVDLSPGESVDRGGKRIGQATAATAFDADHPFKLSVTDLLPNWPVLVDLQFRPVISGHLAYAMNVLNWPAGDVDGQIQHAADTTFATTNPDDTAGANGDVRLVPLLEIVLTGGEIPLKLAEPAARVTVGSGTAVSSTVGLSPDTDPAGTQITFLQGASLKVYGGTCGALGTQLGTTFTQTPATLSDHTVLELADGNHAVVVDNGTVSACADLADVANGMYTDKMVDTSVLDPYGITAHDQGDGSVVLYVPLNVTADDTGGGKAAFQARVLYWPGCGPARPACGVSPSR